MFSFREKAIYALGFFAFIFVGPTLMYWIATTFPMTFLVEDQSVLYLGALT